ncbi:transcription antiterminator [Halalkalibacterium halodurans]|jgi:transcriptional antiterminator|uniref:Transcriptional antiterminator n=2 Tax=Halalkalibacterium halodurans TaxID=86665 RepID=Q9KEK7_HALH5|nr:transcription antiterminator [Halalkalibacterium halodurans]MED3648465.1 transcription antiterminator [Halalkalibacterium halodurans]MED4080791.1 transcription antiterminator [Halalkalibacterium halodurans]MED4086248.1 transcription antiterminator [Halalkalibacterium halodurans]MED4106930.1 transcription antiterminator [Halalkalibacterium halodurans]MED4110259.1 transcription antiterminator [Halalkalibacterium halodurans]
MLVVKKALNNNVLIAEHPSYDEVVLIGKGLGFGKRPGDEVAGESAEKFFVLKDAKEQEQYKQLLDYVDESFIGFMNDAIERIEERFQVRLHEHIHVALTDHLFYAIKRINQGFDIKNPFLTETELAYPKEFDVATEIIQALEAAFHISIPPGEIGFVALHIHSALTRRSLEEVNQHTRLISELVYVIETSLELTIDRQHVDYLRLVRHLHHAIERIQKGEYNDNQERLKKILKEEYPVCYNLSYKLIKIMQQSLKKAIPDAEAVYLTLHLQRLAKE